MALGGGVTGPLVILMVLALVFAGCLAEDARDPPTVVEDEPLTEAAAPTAVIADISPGVNPYHESFRRDWTHPPWERVPGLDDVTVLELTFGEDYTKSRGADEAIWNGFETHTLYWVNGTNLLLYSDRPTDWLPDGDERTIHGTGTADAVNQACRDCYVLVYQDSASIDGQPVRRIAEEMPWVDIVTSTNIPGDYNPLAGQHESATRELWNAGRIYISFAGNSVAVGLINPNAPFPIHHVDFPPWVVTVGGAHSACNGSDLLAGKPPEIVGNFTQRLADIETIDGYRFFSGTSFATPQVAGMMGRALADVRTALGHNETTDALWEGDPIDGSDYLDDGRLTQAELRDVVSRSARYFATEEYVPLACPGISGVPASPTPWIDMGWGYLGHIEAALAAQVILGREDPEQKPAAAGVWMDRYMAAREAMFPW